MCFGYDAMPVLSPIERLPACLGSGLAELALGRAHEDVAGPVTTGDAGERPDGTMFVADITEVVITGLDTDATELVVESWTAERGLQRVELTAARRVGRRR